LNNGFFGHDFAVFVAERPEDTGIPPGMRVSFPMPLLEQQSEIITRQQAELAALRTRVAGMETSSSWRLTAPLRGLKEFFRKIAQ
jgi:hypothetical protein